MSEGNGGDQGGDYLDGGATVQAPAEEVELSKQQEPMLAIKTGTANKVYPEVEKEGETDEVEIKKDLPDFPESQETITRMKTLKDEDDKEVSSLKELTCRAKGLFVWDHMIFIGLMTFLVLVAMGFLFLSMFNVTIDGTPVDQIEIVKTLDIVIVGFFCFETLMRMVWMGPKLYFTNGLCLIDLTVTIIDLVGLALDQTLSANGDSTNLQIVKVLRVFRLSKISRVARLTAKVDEVENSERGKVVEKDEDGHIFAYNSGTLFSTGFLYNLSGTVLSMPEIWVQCLVFLILQTLFAAITCPKECDPISNAYDSPCTETHPGCVNTIEPDYGLMFLGLASFLLGIFAQLLFDRWWDTRLMIQQLFAEIKDTTMMTVSFVRGNDEKSTRLRRDLMRWSKLGAFLLEKQIDGKSDYREAIDLGYMKQSEWDQIESIEEGAYILPQVWGFDSVCRAADENKCQEYGGTLDNLIMSFCKQRNLCADILMILDTPMPYIFTHLMTLICKVTLLFLAIACGTLAGQAVPDKQWTTLGMAYIMVFLGNFMIEGLLRLHVVLSDPFGDDACDFPWQQMMIDLDKECDLMATQFENMPYDEKNFLMDETKKAK